MKKSKVEVWYALKRRINIIKPNKMKSLPLLVKKAITKRLQIEYFKSLSYNEINNKFNKLNVKINKLEKQLRIIKTK